MEEHSHAHVQMADPFAIIPEAIIYDTGLTDGAVRVYLALVRHGLDPANCFPSHARIAELIGKSERSIRRPLEELEQAGWIETFPRWRDDGGRSSNAYRVHTSAPHASFDGVPPARQNAMNESNSEREQLNEKQPSRSASAIVPAPGSLTDDETFGIFWQAYPQRNGKRVGKKQARTQWGKLDRDRQRLAFKAAVNYAAACAGGLTIAKDAHRWLRDGNWSEWDEPATPEPTKQQRRATTRRAMSKRAGNRAAARRSGVSLFGSPVETTAKENTG